MRGREESAVRLGDPFNLARHLSRLSRLRKNPSHCHPEEAKPVLSETKEGPLYLLENSNTGVLRFAQDDSTEAFFRSLYLPMGESYQILVVAPLCERRDFGPELEDR